jgi:hypothetical protein
MVSNGVVIGLLALLLFIVFVGIALKVRQPKLPKKKIDISHILAVIKDPETIQLLESLVDGSALILTKLNEQAAAADPEASLHLEAIKADAKKYLAKIASINPRTINSHEQFLIQKMVQDIDFWHIEERKIRKGGKNVRKI